MEATKENIIHLVAAFGWSQILSKNPYMLSFVKDDAPEYIRMNVYFTKMTIQIQYEDGRQSINKDCTLSELETLASSV